MNVAPSASSISHFVGYPDISPPPSKFCWNPLNFHSSCESQLTVTPTQPFSTSTHSSKLNKPKLSQMSHSFEDHGNPQWCTNQSSNFKIGTQHTHYHNHAHVHLSGVNDIDKPPSPIEEPQQTNHVNLPTEVRQETLITNHKRMDDTNQNAEVTMKNNLMDDELTRVLFQTLLNPNFHSLVSNLITQGLNSIGVQKWHDFMLTDINKFDEYQMETKHGIKLLFETKRDQLKYLQLFVLHNLSMGNPNWKDPNQYDRQTLIEFVNDIQSRKYQDTRIPS